MLRVTFMRQRIRPHSLHPAGLATASLLATLGLFASVGVARAQTMTVETLAIPNRESNRFNLTVNPIGKSECDASLIITVRLRNVPTDKPQLDLWRGNDCNTMAQRMPTTGSCTQITTLSRATSGLAEFEMMLPVRDLTGCAGDTESTYKIFFLPVASAGSSEEVTKYTVLDLKLDTLAPAAPTGVVGRRGEQPGVSWTRLTGNDIYQYRVFTDLAALDCTSDVLISGNPAPSSGGISVSGDSSEADVDGVMLGEKAVVAVATVDMARNVGVLSALVCVEAVETDGFWERYQRTGGTAETCSAAPLSAGVARGARAFGLCALLVAAMVLARRRSSR